MFFKGTSEVFQLEKTKPITKTFCQFCDAKDQIIKILEEQTELRKTVKKRNILSMYNKHNEDKTWLLLLVQ